MNRYLIVVFCVLTGCAAAVPAAYGQDVSVDQQLLAEWYANHIQQLDENYSQTLLVSIEKDHFAERILPQSDKKFSPLKNLPRIPALSGKSGRLDYPEPESVVFQQKQLDFYCSASQWSDNPIRAPGANC